MPHTTKCFVDILHDLRWRFGPAEFEELLPDMASISMYDSFGNATKEFVNHDCLIILGNGVKCFLNNVTTESVHGEIQRVTADCFGDLDNLLRCAMFEAALD